MWLEILITRQVPISKKRDEMPTLKVQTPLCSWKNNSLDGLFFLFSFFFLICHVKVEKASSKRGE